MIHHVLRIWFNRTYATNVHTLAMLRDNPDGVPVHVIATHVDPDSPVMLAADERYPEPPAERTGEDYVAWALAFCRAHAVDVLVPCAHLAELSRARSRLQALGVALVAGPAEAATLLDDKAAAYADAEAAGLPVPPWRVATTGAELVAAYDGLAPLGEVVIKPVGGVGAEGFRVVTRAPLALDDLLGPLTPRVHLDEAAAALDAPPGPRVETPRLLVMPFLPGPEVSIDCLADEDGALLAAVPRSKTGRRRELVDDPAAVAVAAAVVRRHRLSSLSNTQVRYWQRPGVDDAPRPYFLETNARIAGGLFQTGLSGINLAWAAVRLARGEEVVLPQPKLGVSYATVSSLVTYPA